MGFIQKNKHFLTNEVIVSFLHCAFIGSLIDFYLDFLYLFLDRIWIYLIIK